MEKTTKDYTEIAAAAIEQIRNEPPGVKVKEPEHYITAELCRRLDLTVGHFVPLKSFWEENGLSRTVYILYLQHVLPFLYQPEAMYGYFLTLLVGLHNAPETWHIPSKKWDFEMITGLCFQYEHVQDKERSSTGIDRRAAQLFTWFAHTYDDLFVFEKRYPQDLIKEVRRCVDENVPMPHTYKDFTGLYMGRRDAPYLQFISEVVYRHYGKERTQQYFDAVLEQYIGQHPGYRNGNAYLQDILMFVFGEHFSRNCFLPRAHVSAKYKSDDTLLLRMKALFLRRAWPYIYGHYSTRHTVAYEMMQLTEEEIEAYEEQYFGGKVRRYTDPRMSLTMDPETYRFPNGSSYDEIKSVIRRYYRVQVAQTRVIPLRDDAYREIIRQAAATAAVIRDIKHMLANTWFKPWLITAMDEEENRLRIEFSRTNDAELSTEKDTLHLYLLHKGRYVMKEIDFSDISAPVFRQEARMYCRKVLWQKISMANIAKVRRVIAFMQDMTKDFRIGKSRSVRREHVLVWLHRKQLDGMKPTTIQSMLYSVRDLLDVLMSKDYEYRPEANVCTRIRFFGTKDHVESRPTIPDDVLVFLDRHIWELDEEWRLLYKILRATCWRFDDAANLRVDGVYELDGELDIEFAGIKTAVSKTKKQLRKHQAPEYAEDVIPADLFHEIQDYVVATQAARDIYGTDYVFFSGRGGMAHQVSPGAFSIAINELLERHGISSIDETYSRFSSAQPRATGATTLIEAGVDLTAVQKKLIHLNPETTAKHYARTREKRQADLDVEFFKKTFEDLFDKEKLALLTPQQRKALYEDWSFSVVQTEFGSCGNRPCQDRCGRYGTSVCAECAKLVTGPKNLGAWERLKESSDTRLAEMTDLYDAKGIPAEQYSIWPEYAEELRHNTAYRSVIEKIVAWKEARDRDE